MGVPVAFMSSSLYSFGGDSSYYHHLRRMIYMNTEKA
ncbi:hypothetical protein ACP4OV_010268 [Aristida adscensionis]